MLESLLSRAINILSDIASSSSSSSSKLDALNKLSGTVSLTNVNANSNTPVVVNAGQQSVSDSLLGAKQTRNASLAQKIASGQ